MLKEKMKNEWRNKLIIEKFTPGDVSNIYEELTADHWALKALGSLLASSNLEDFTGDDAFAADRRCGLERIIFKYIDSQEKMLDEFFAKSTNSPEWWLEKVEHTVNDTKNGRYNDCSLALRLIAEALNKVEAIITQFETDEYPKAVLLRNELLKSKEYYSEKMTMKKAI